MGSSVIKRYFIFFQVVPQIRYMTGDPAAFAEIYILTQADTFPKC